MFMLPLFALLRHLAEPTPFLPLSSLPQKSLHSGRFPLPSLPLELKSYFIPRGEEVLDWVISSDLLPLMTMMYLLFSIAPLAVAPPLTSSLLPPLSPSLAPGKRFMTWVLITYQFY